MGENNNSNKHTAIDRQGLALDKLEKEAVVPKEFKTSKEEDVL